MKTAEYVSTRPWGGIAFSSASGLAPAIVKSIPSTVKTFTPPGLGPALAIFGKGIAMTIDHLAAEALALKSFIAVRVRYVGSAHPYIHEARERETLGELKPLVLRHFGLFEGNVDGGSKVYEFSVHDELQTDLSVTLHELSHGHHELSMHLLEKFTQG